MPAYIPWLTFPPIIFQKPAVSILVPLAAGMGVGLSVPSRSVKGLYQVLKKPPLSPPAYVFAPVWTCLYTLMGYAAHRAWVTGLNATDPNVSFVTKQAATIYTVQLALNLAFQPIFFVLKRPILATVDLFSVTGLVGYLIYQWFKVDETAAWCLLPYFTWMCFATYVGTATGYLNDWDFNSPLKLSSKSQ